MCLLFCHLTHLLITSKWHQYSIMHNIYILCICILNDLYISSRMEQRTKHVYDFDFLQFKMDNLLIFYKNKLYLYIKELRFKWFLLYYYINIIFYHTYAIHFNKTIHELLMILNRLKFKFGAYLAEQLRMLQSNCTYIFSL